MRYSTNQHEDVGTRIAAGDALVGADLHLIDAGRAIEGHGVSGLRKWLGRGGIAGKQVVKVVVVPNKLINLVLNV